MDIKKLKQLIQMLEETDVTEIEIHEGEESVRISRANHGFGMPTMGIPQIHATHHPFPQFTTSPAVETTSNETLISVTGHTLTAPMVGTVYFSPSPEAPAFVTVGQHVKWVRRFVLSKP